MKLALLASIIVAGCGTAPAPAHPVENAATPVAPPASAAPTLPTDDGTQVAPWTVAPIAPGAVPPVFMQVWAAAGNRDACPLLVPAWLGAGASAAPAPAEFVGGWGVAYRQPALCEACGDSAFGVAGVGGEVDDGVDAGWAKHVSWSDGSHAGYGLVGDTGPGWLAYLVVAGSGCNYNVWSNVSEAHLLGLLGSLRHVQR
jgi:hypothetical protein